MISAVAVLVNVKFEICFEINFATFQPQPTQLAYLLKSIIKSNLINGCPTESPGERGFEYIKRWGGSSRILKLTLKGDQSGLGSSILC